MPSKKDRQVRRADLTIKKCCRETVYAEQSPASRSTTAAAAVGRRTTNGATNTSSAAASGVAWADSRASRQGPSPATEPQNHYLWNRSPILEITKNAIQRHAPTLRHQLIHKVSEQQKVANDKYDKIAKRFVIEEVIELIECSTTYNKIIRTKDPEEFMDITLVNWDTCTSIILSRLRKEFKEKKVVPNQSLLIRICKLAARKVYKRHKLVMQLKSKTA